MPALMKQSLLVMVMGFARMARITATVKTAVIPAGLANTLYVMAPVLSALTSLIAAGINCASMASLAIPALAIAGAR